MFANLFYKLDGIFVKFKHRPRVYYFKVLIDACYIFKHLAVQPEIFDEANFLFGIKGQTVESIRNDIELGLKYFERICINIMCENSTSVKPDKELIKAFIKEIYPIYKDNDRADILINNTDFGVGD